MATLRPRADAYSPRSVGWSLYNPGDVAEKLGLPLEAMDLALEETGFNKAVRIREMIIRWKTELLAEQKKPDAEYQTHRLTMLAIKHRRRQVDEMLTNIRNILRIPREKPVKEAS